MKRVLFVSDPTTTTSVSDLVISSALYRQIETEGSAAYPNECCGFLIGRDVKTAGTTKRLIESLEPGRNAFEANEQYHRFSIDPKQQLEVEKIAEEQGRIVLGYYHSHPDHPARPSEYDRQHAWPFYSYVIVAIEKAKSAAMTSWVLNDQTEQFMKQEIVVVG
jgi:proteasome lid subunit RPN8/RPN11